jgi:hypothetical protein
MDVFFLRLNSAHVRPLQSLPRWMRVGRFGHAIQALHTERRSGRTSVPLTLRTSTDRMD